MTRTITEKVRVGRAHALIALEAYRTTGGQDDDDAAAIGDLIADLLHLAETRGVLPSEMDAFVERALGHYDYESNPDHADEDA